MTINRNFPASEHIRPIFVGDVDPGGSLGPDIFWWQPTAKVFQVRNSANDAWEPIIASTAVEMTSDEFVTDGLVVGYKFTDNAGPTLTDFGPSGLHGTLNGGAAWIGSRGIFFDGSNDFISVPAHASLRLTTAFTAEFKFTWASLNNAAIFDKTGADVTNKNYQLHITAAGAVNPRVVKGTVNQEFASPTISVNAIYHGFMTYNGQRVSVFIDGFKTAISVPVAAPIDDVDGILRIGSLGATIFPHHGNIYKFAIYNKVLSFDEMKAAMEATV